MLVHSRHSIKIQQSACWTLADGVNNFMTKIPPFLLLLLHSAREHHVPMARMHHGHCQSHEECLTNTNLPSSMQPPNVGIVLRGGQSFPNLPLEQPRTFNDCCLFSFAFVMQVSDVEVYGLAQALHVSYVLDPHFRTKAGCSH
jgi:hypothetical protein